MAERLSALAGFATADAGAPLTLREARPAAILLIQAWPDTLATVEAVAAQLVGSAEAPRPGFAAVSSAGLLAALGAGRFLLSADNEEVAVAGRTAFVSNDAAVTDVTHGRTVITLEGEAAAELLLRLAPIDFDAVAFPPGRAAQTAIHHIDVLICRRSEARCDIFALRSFAQSLAEWIADAGAELGTGFTPPIARR